MRLGQNMCLDLRSRLVLGMSQDNSIFSTLKSSLVVLTMCQQGHYSGGRGNSKGLGFDPLSDLNAGTFLGLSGFCSNVTRNHRCSIWKVDEFLLPNVCRWF